MLIIACHKTDDNSRRDKGSNFRLWTVSNFDTEIKNIKKQNKYFDWFYFCLNDLNYIKFERSQDTVQTVTYTCKVESTTRLKPILCVLNQQYTGAKKADHFWPGAYI